MYNEKKERNGGTVLVGWIALLLVGLIAGVALEDGVEDALFWTAAALVLLGMLLLLVNSSWGSW